MSINIVDDTAEAFPSTAHPDAIRTQELHLEDIDFDMVCPAFKSKLID